MLRLRDILAVLAVVFLTRLAYDDPSESLAATVQLNYYVGRESISGARASKDHMQKLALAPLGMDVDGDGTIEALASWAKDTKSNSWSLEILDLKPAASTDKTHMAPFRPQQLYRSEDLKFQSALNGKKEVAMLPITMTTGHVPVQQKGKSASGNNNGDSKPPLTKRKFKDTELNDRNRHYFCGTDWHDASTRCGAPCPTGTSGDCPEGEQCFADTPCDINDYDPHSKREEDDQAKVINDMLVSPAGGLPSVFSLWSNGVLVMHSLTGDAPPDLIAVKKKQNRMKDLLGVRKMWEADIIKDASVVPYDWESVSVTFVDATDAGDASGMVVVQAHMVHMEADDEGEEEEYEDQFFVAFDAYTGKKLWDMSLIQKDEEKSASNSTIPLQFSEHSSARRRSMKPFVSKSKNERMDANCMHAYRRSLFTSGALPHSFYGNADAESVALHFEQQRHNQHQQHAIQAKKFHGKPGSEIKKGSWKNALSPFARRRHANNKPKRGKPNVIASRSDHGIAIHSLKNGRSVCHASLWYDTLYDDVNHDGVLDGLFVVTGDHFQEDDDDVEEADRKWIKKLHDRLKDQRMLASDFDEEDEKMEDQTQRLCHLMALSGIPVKEELFSINLCGKNELQDDTDELDPAPLLAVEPAYGKGKDIVVALNNKSVQRYRGSNGRRVWKLDGKHHADFPTWEEGDDSLLDRIEVPNIAPQARPIVLTGDTSITLLSPRRGSVLATATFPQPAIRRPILVDFNGDGTSDVVVVTNEAVWGYRVKVRTGSSIMFRIVVGLLTLGLMLAVIRNRFGPHPGKRGSDA